MYRAAALAALVPMVAAHGFISSPAARRPGDAYAAACGAQPFNQQSSDINGNVQGIMQVVGSDLDASACKLWLCKGFQFEDNTDNVQSYSLGQTIDMEIDIAAPHTGVANVSVVKTSTDTIIGTPLIEFENYASNAGVDESNRAFSITLPEDLQGECTTAGDCVLQWYWDAADINQTYESCVDFTVSGGSGTAPSDPAPSDPVEEPIEEPIEEPEEDDEEEDEDLPECPADDEDDEVEEPIEEDDEEPIPDDECPADDEEEEEGLEPVEEDDEYDDECPADDEEDVEEPIEEDDDEYDDECPVDEEEDEEELPEDECPADDEEDLEEDEEEAPIVENPVQPAPSSTGRSIVAIPTTFATVTREVTVTASASTVTVTAEPSAECTTV